MSVWKDRKGRFHVAVQRGGVRVHRICPEASTWRQAKDKESELLNRFQAATTGKVLIADAIQHWLKEEVAHHKAKRGTEGHAYALAEFISGRSIGDIALVAEEYKRSLRGRVTNSTINRRLAVLRRVANLAYRRWGWLQDPVGTKIEFLTENPARERFLDRSELAKLLRGIPNRSMRKAALVAAFTGLRRGELARLRPINVQGDLIHLKTTKNGLPRTIPVVHHVRFAVVSHFDFYKGGCVAFSRGCGVGRQSCTSRCGSWRSPGRQRSCCLPPISASGQPFPRSSIPGSSGSSL